MSTTPDRPDFKAIGKAAQILPSYLRLICRARIDCTPPEMLEVAKMIALDNIAAQAQEGPAFAFLERHRMIIEAHDPADLMDRLEHKVGGGQGSALMSRMAGGTCAMQAHAGAMKTAKSRCWSCSIIADLIRDLKP